MDLQLRRRVEARIDALKTYNHPAIKKDALRASGMMITGQYAPALALVETLERKLPDEGRIIDILSAKLADRFNRGPIRRLISAGNVQVNKAVVTDPNKLIRGPAKITIYIKHSDEIVTVELKGLML